MTLIWSGLTLGAIYAIVAVGYNIVFTSSRVFNFAQAQFLMIGAFVALETGQRFGVPLLVALLFCLVVGAVVGGLEEVLAVRRLYGRASHSELVTTLGVSTILSGMALVLYGSEPRTIPYLADTGTISLLGGRVAITDLVIIVSALVLAGVVGVVTRRTMLGLSSLAASEDRDAAMLRGVNVKALAFGAFAIAGALVALLGPVVAAKTYATYQLGDALAVKAFVALTIGGFGSQSGAVLGGFVVGFLEIYAARYLGSEWRNIAVFVVLLVIMMARPTGLFARRIERVV